MNSKTLGYAAVALLAAGSVGYGAAGHFTASSAVATPIGSIQKLPTAKTKVIGPSPKDADEAVAAGYQRLDVSSVYGVGEPIVPLPESIAAKNERLGDAFVSCVSENGATEKALMTTPDSDAVRTAVKACQPELSAQRAYQASTTYGEANAAAERRAKIIWPCLDKAGFIFDAGDTELYVLTPKIITLGYFADVLKSCRAEAEAAD